MHRKKAFRRLLKTSLLFYMFRRMFIMKKETIFKGAGTALITPFNEDGVDYESLGALIDWQIEEGIDALIICGTTGENPTLSDPEHKKVLEFSAQRINGRVPFIAGTGSNDTAHAIEMTRFACSIGADACLVVSPYYNKATQNGLIASFNKIADESTKPLVIYDVPSRTGVTIQPATFAALAEHPNIAAIKEASGNIAKIVEEFSLVGDKLDIYSGNDDEVIPIMSMGGMGVISVLSNIMPKETAAMCAKYFEGDIKGAAALQCEYTPIIKALFSQVNPIPVKTALAAMGRCKEIFRLPMTAMDEGPKAALLELLKDRGLI